ncbi:hypothetical protein INR49_030217 [Caranx melampygus]|nr:hypothetical protein INR49_030217 [Caranx melampygus]
MFLAYSFAVVEENMFFFLTLSIIMVWTLGQTQAVSQIWVLSLRGHFYGSFKSLNHDSEGQNSWILYGQYHYMFAFIV